MLRLVPILAILLLAMLTGCSSSVTDHYETLQEAVEDSLFERGWLPNILPPSARRITTSNDLDINSSRGEFYFNTHDLGEFVSRLESYYPLRGAPPDVSSLVRKRQSSGYHAYLYWGDQKTWLFVCHPEKGHCEYRMW